MDAAAAAATKFVAREKDGRTRTLAPVEWESGQANLCIFCRLFLPSLLCATKHASQRKMVRAPTMGGAYIERLSEHSLCCDGLMWESGGVGDGEPPIHYSLVARISPSWNGRRMIAMGAAILTSSKVGNCATCLNDTNFRIT